MQLQMRGGLVPLIIKIIVYGFTVSPVDCNEKNFKIRMNNDILHLPFTSEAKGSARISQCDSNLFLM